MKKFIMIEMSALCRCIEDAEEENRHQTIMHTILVSRKKREKKTWGTLERLLWGGTQVWTSKNGGNAKIKNCKKKCTEKLVLIWPDKKISSIHTKLDADN